jgi:acid phosphatase type 7
MMKRSFVRYVVSIALAALLAFPAAAELTSVGEAMDAIVGRLYANTSVEDLAKLSLDSIPSLLSEEELRILATKHVTFEVDAPAVVSIFRDKGQREIPFWLAGAGFVKTELEAKNVDNWGDFECWQKKVPAGAVELGINGFQNHRAHYFVTVGAQEKGKQVTLTNVLPDEYPVVTAKVGAHTYNDWSSLVLSEVPESVVGHHLLTTIRGRSRDAHLIGAFRLTDYPSSPQPDQVMLTWNRNPRKTQTVQWRTSTDVQDGVVRWRKKAGSRSRETIAQRIRVQDRLLANDRYVHRYTAVLKKLKPATTYIYSVGSSKTDQWSEEAEFTTAPRGNAPFTFLVTGDTHNRPEWGAMMDQAVQRHPKAVFYTIAGDLVGTGQYRNDWDALFHHGRNVFSRMPLMPTLGNHDAIDGLGPGLFLQLFALPENGAKAVTPERSYAFEYGNALMIILDATASPEDQEAWLEETLRKSKATWKFASYHFPNYDPRYSKEYQDYTRLWSTHFDTYHVDMVFNGHVHYYMRSLPINNGEIMDTPAEGTIYNISIGIPNRSRPESGADYVAKSLSGVGLYQTIDIDGNKMQFRAWDAEGKLWDELVVSK